MEKGGLYWCYESRETVLRSCPECA